MVHWWGASAPPPSKHSKGSPIKFPMCPKLWSSFHVRTLDQRDGYFTFQYKPIFWGTPKVLGNFCDGPIKMAHSCKVGGKKKERIYTHNSWPSKKNTCRQKEFLQPMKWSNMHPKGPSFFFSIKERVALLNFCCSHKILLCSHQVPNGFPMCSPNMFLMAPHFIPYILPKGLLL
jgi:hypothetical protein